MGSGGGRGGERERGGDAEWGGLNAVDECWSGGWCRVWVGDLELALLWDSVRGPEEGEEMLDGAVSGERGRGSYDHEFKRAFGLDEAACRITRDS